MDIKKYSASAINRMLAQAEAHADKHANGKSDAKWAYLAGYLQSEIKTMAMDIYASLTAPHKYAVEIIYTWNTDCSESIECRLDYQRAEKQTHEYPGCPASVQLTAAYLRGVDIYHLLSPDQISEIEEKALISATE